MLLEIKDGNIKVVEHDEENGSREHEYSYRNGHVRHEESEYRDNKRGGMSSYGSKGKTFKSKEHEELCDDIDRIKDELEGFIKYKELAKKRTSANNHNTKQYDIASMQEFKHMLLALDDFFSDLAPMISPEEKTELTKFFRNAVNP